MTPRPEIGYHPARVLIVDDERHNRELLEVMLGPEGLLLQTAASGEEALAKVALEPPDLILLDIMMPGMDGYQVAADIKGSIATKNIPVIMVTALDDRNARLRGLRAGAEEFLTKPVDRVELCVRVRNLLRLKAYSDYFDQYSQMLEAEVSSRTADLVERTKQAAELLLLTERLSLATAIAKVGVWEWHLASNTLTWDATMFDIYGCAPVVPMPYATWSAAVYPEDLAAVEATRQKAIDEKGQGSAEYRIRRPDGSLRNVSGIERVVLDEHVNVSRVIGVDMDVTEHKRAEEALEQIRQDDLRFKDEFLSHVSHELRSPLTAIKQFTTILLGGLAGELNPEQREYQQIVLRNIGQLQSMIDDLLEVTRLESGKLTVELESVSVADAVTDAFNTLQGTALAKGITLSCDLQPDLPRAHVDQTRLRQVLIILLDNAVKFTPDAGAVTVQARLRREDPRFLLLEVSDTGCGISPEISERVFERLYQVSERIQTSRKGLGLGLYICKELVTRQGGQIWVTRRPQKGTTFSFTLPVMPPDNAIAPAIHLEESIKPQIISAGV
jgi:PAS domain S-box-containing protein